MPADFEKYHVVLFGDPGSNRWIAKLDGKLSFRWTKDTVTLGAQKSPAADHFPVMIYPNSLSPARYVVINSGLTILDREYNGNYGMLRLGDFAVLKVNPTADVADTATAGRFDESWRLPPAPPAPLP